MGPYKSNKTFWDAVLNGNQSCTVFRVKPGTFLGDKGNAAAGSVVLHDVDAFWVWMLPKCKKERFRNFGPLGPWGTLLGRHWRTWWKSFKPLERHYRRCPMPRSSLVCEGLKLVRVILVLIVGFINFKAQNFLLLLGGCSGRVGQLIYHWTIPSLPIGVEGGGDDCFRDSWADIQLSFVPLHQHFTVSLRCPRIVVMYPHIKPSGGAATEESAIVASSRRYSKKFSEHWLTKTSIVYNLHDPRDLRRISSQSKVEQKYEFSSFQEANGSGWNVAFIPTLDSSNFREKAPELGAWETPNVARCLCRPFVEQRGSLLLRHQLTKAMWNRGEISRVTSGRWFGYLSTFFLWKYRTFLVGIRRHSLCHRQVWGAYLWFTRNAWFLVGNNIIVLRRPILRADIPVFQI